MKALQNIALLSVLSLPVVVNAGVLTESATAPTTSLISQPLFDGGLDGGKDYSNNNGVPGQTFTVGANNITVTAITIKGGGSSGGFDLDRFFVLSIASSTGTTSGTLTRVTQEVSQAFAPAARDNSSSYLTFTLATPVVLLANRIYEYDIYTTDTSDPNVQSANGGYYGFAKSSGDSYAGGAAMQNGFSGSNARFSANPGSVNTPQTSDRTFFIQGTAVPEPSSIAFLGLAASGGVFYTLRRRKATLR